MTASIPRDVSRGLVQVAVQVKDTGRCGLGVFAAEPVSKGSSIATLSGERISYDECYERVFTDGALSVDDPLQIDDQTYFILDGVSRLFNHSCDANAALRGEADLHALRDIAAGEEITFDYSATVSPHVVPLAIWTMKCHCGAANCRSLLGHVLTMPPERIVTYLEQGAFQDYMKRVLIDFAKRIQAASGKASAESEISEQTPRQEKGERVVGHRNV